jgi:hypothetical protein
LVFRHIKLKLLTKASILCLSHPSMSITTWFMSVFAIACTQKITHFFIFHRAISEKLQHIKLWKSAVVHTSSGTSSLPSMNKIRDGRVFSLVHLTWNDPTIILNFSFRSDYSQYRFPQFYFPPIQLPLRNSSWTARQALCYFETSTSTTYTTKSHTIEHLSFRL